MLVTGSERTLVANISAANNYDLAHLKEPVRSPAPGVLLSQMTWRSVPSEAERHREEEKGEIHRHTHTGKHALLPLLAFRTRGHWLRRPTTFTSPASSSPCLPPPSWRSPSMLLRRRRFAFASVHMWTCVYVCVCVCWRFVTAIEWDELLDPGSCHEPWSSVHLCRLSRADNGCCSTLVG